MRICDFSDKTVFDTTEFPISCHKSKELFIICTPHEVSVLQTIFGFDESTVRDCTDLDESVRFTGFYGYDFISLVHIELLGDDLVMREINLYVSSCYLVLVMPGQNSFRLQALEKKLIDATNHIEERSNKISVLYYLVYNYLLADFSDTLETLEDRMQALSEEIVFRVDTAQFAQVNMLRTISYAAKKQLRALSYLGDHILLDENKLIIKSQMHYFRNVDTRLKKLYDFAESLYNLSGEMLNTYDSKLTMKTNDTVNKLTILTLFFGPLTVITGIYGMNFDNMPETKWPFGYYLALGVMVVVSLFLYVILKRKKWL